jgi:hypothetical protein
MSIDPAALRKKCGLSHPLAHWATGPINEFFADIVLEFIHDSVFETESFRYKGVLWFLLESESFLYACHHAGLNGPGLRAHLKQKIDG